jgi:hypothetical protein
VAPFEWWVAPFEWWVAPFEWWVAPFEWWVAPFECCLSQKTPIGGWHLLNAAFPKKPQSVGGTF